MKIPGFWRQDRATWQSVLLTPLGFLYGALTLRRMRRHGWRAPVSVISIGNFTAGGAGKTPTAIAIAEALLRRGETPFFLTRGYGGQERGPLRVDPLHHGAEAVGDEPLLLARVAPTIVARERAKGARLAVAEGASVLVLDDALQNPDLVKDFSIAVIDGGFGLGNSRVLPAGPLRAPLDASLPFVDAIVLVGEDRHAITPRLAAAKPCHFARLRAHPTITASLVGQRVIAFSGIALPEKFETTLRESGATIVEARRFPDHHPFTESEAEGLLALGEKTGARLVTTEKDHVRLAGGRAVSRLGEAALALPVRLEVAPALFEAIYRVLEAARSRVRMASGPE